MTPELSAILKIQVPVMVRLGQRRLPLQQVLDLRPGSMIELPQRADTPLDLTVNNKTVGRGRAVRVGQSYGIQIDQVGETSERVRALSAPATPPPSGNDDQAGDDQAAEGQAEDDQAEATPPTEG